MPWQRTWAGADRGTWLLVAVVAMLAPGVGFIAHGSPAPLSVHSPLLPRGPGGPATVALVSGVPGVDGPRQTDAGGSGPSVGRGDGSSVPAGVVETLDLINNTTQSGNFRASNGRGPAAVAVDPLDGYVFVANRASANVTVFNGSTTMVVGSVSVGSEPRGMAFDPTDGYLYVAIFPAGNLTVIDGADLRVVGSIPLGEASTDVAFDPSNGNLYAAEPGTGTVAVINTTLDAESDAIAVGGTPVAVACGPSGQVYVANSLSDNVSVVDDATGRLVGSVGVGSDPQGLAVDPSTGLLYVADEGSRAVSVVNTSTEQVVATVAVGTEPSDVAVDAANDRVYVANFGSDNVSVVNGSTSKPLVGIPVGLGPMGLGVDPSTGEVLVADSGSDALTVIDATTDAVVAQRSVGVFPWAAAFDASNAMVYVSEALPEAVVAINGSHDQLVGSVTTGTESGNGPGGLAIDTASGDLYAANGVSDNVSVIDAATDRLVASLAVGTSPAGVAYDGSNGELYVADSGSDAVTIIDGATHRVVGSVVVGSDPVAIALDPQSGMLYVANSGTNNLTVIDPTDGEVAFSMTVGAGPSAEAFDTANGQLFVTDGLSDNVTVVAGADGPVLGAIPVGADPDGVAYDNFDGDLYVANAGSDNLTVIDGSTDEVVGSVSVGLAPLGVTYDSANRNLYVAEFGSGTVSVVSPDVPAYPVTFSEVGLPSGTRWSVDVAGVSNASGTGRSTLWEANGTGYRFSVGPLSGYTAQPASGIFNVSGSAVEIPIVFGLVTYALRFQEAGLPTGLVWTVEIGGETESSGTSVIAFDEPNGTYRYNVTPPSGYVTNPSGVADVDAMNSTVTVVFAPARFNLTFVETGLTVAADLGDGPSTSARPASVGPPVFVGALWGVTVDGISISTVLNEINISLPNGTYGYRILPVPDFTTPANGTVTVDGADQSIPVAFSEVRYSVRFVDGGLPPGTRWNVTVWVSGCPPPGSTPIRLGLCGWVSATGTGPITFDLPNGNYTYSGSSSFYGSVVGPFVVNGAAIPTIDVSFDTLLWLPTTDAYALIVVGLAVAPATIAFVVYRWRRRHRPPEPPMPGPPSRPPEIREAEFRVVEDDAPPGTAP